MTAVPRYHFPAGTKIVLPGRTLFAVRTGPDGYEFVGADDDAAITIPFAQLVDELKLPDVRIDKARATTGNRLQHRLGGYACAEQLSEDQQAHAKFHVALCGAMVQLRDKLRAETGQPNLALSIRQLDKPENRKFIRDAASDRFGRTIYASKPPGGKGEHWVLYRGRTLVKYLAAHDGLASDERPMDALVPLVHLRGNRTLRLNHRLLDLMTDAWEKIGLDTRKRSIASVRKYLETLINEENPVRVRNGLTQLIVPADKTIKDHRDQLLRPSEVHVAISGIVATRNQHGRGSTDIRALMIGEYVEIDECKLSLVTLAKANGLWERLSSDQQATLEEIDKEIAARLICLVVIDVATRMPLAWVLSDQPKAEATLAALRMATRDKTREKVIYGCEGTPADPVGILHIKNDNGPGLRNRQVKEALLGIGAINTDARAYAATDKTYVERFFGTLEDVLLKLLHGYTGRKAGDLPGYDAKKAGALDIDELYGILTRFFIDEYPSTRHYGFGMGGRRPAEVYKEIMKNREAIGVIDTNLRRIHLGWKDEVTPTHEGVRVFSGIWFNSGALQKDEKCRRRKVQVWVDPDDINRATVLIPGVEKPVEVFLQNSAFADLTLAEALEVMAMWRRENPDVTNIHEDRLARVRRERFDSQRRIGVERRLPRSYSTIEECRKKGKAVFAGTRILRAPPHPGTTPVGSLADRNPGGHVFQLGSGSKVIDADAEDITSAGGAAAPSHDVPETPTPTDEPVPTAKPAATPRQRTTSRPSAEPLPRPTIRKLE